MKTSYISIEKWPYKIIVQICKLEFPPKIAFQLGAI